MFYHSIGYLYRRNRLIFEDIKMDIYPVLNEAKVVASTQEPNMDKGKCFYQANG